MGITVDLANGNAVDFPKADDFRVDLAHLMVFQGQDRVAAFAPGTWVHAQADKEAN